MDDMKDFYKKTTAFNIRKLFDHWIRGVLRAERKRIQLLEAVTPDKKKKEKIKESM
jgi:hypothetical protein